MGEVGVGGWRGEWEGGGVNKRTNQKDNQTSPRRLHPPSPHGSTWTACSRVYLPSPPLPSSPPSVFISFLCRCFWEGGGKGGKKGEVGVGGGEGGGGVNKRTNQKDNQTSPRRLPPPSPPPPPRLHMDSVLTGLPPPSPPPPSSPPSVFISFLCRCFCRCSSCFTARQG